jgi:hypothetical protein
MEDRLISSSVPPEVLFVGGTVLSLVSLVVSEKDRVDRYRVDRRRMGSLELEERLNQGVGLNYPPAVTQSQVLLSM